MKNKQVLSNMILVFWFGWFALAGIMIAALNNWLFSAHYQTEDILVTGATIGIITGGVAALMFFLIGKSHKLRGFDEQGPRFSQRNS